MRKYVLPAFVGVALFVLPLAVFAQNTTGPADATGVTGPATTVGTPLNILPQGTNNTTVNTSVAGGPHQVVNPLGVTSICGLIKALLGAAIAIGIPIAVLFIVFAGFKFVIARGNPGELQQARSNFLWTVIGIGIFLGAWLLASVIANTVNALQAGSGQSSITSCM